ncbi:MAG: translation initiation factor IF-2 [Nitrospiria bacterium]
MRVFELAKKLEVPSKELIVHLGKMGINVKSHMGALTEDDVQAVLKKWGVDTSKKAQKKQKTEKKTLLSTPTKKKRFVLIKKKPAPPPEPVIETPPPVLVEEDGAEKKQPSEIIKDEIQLDAKPASPMEVAATDIAKEEGSASPLAKPSKEIGGAELKAEVVSTASVAEEEKKKAKKKGKPEPRSEPKKISEVKAKEKPKRARRVEWDASGESLGTGTAAEARKWQDFKPIHRKEDRRSGRKTHGGPVVDVAKPRKKVIKIHEGITVKEFSELIGQKVPSIIAKLMELGKMSTVNQAIDLEEASLIAESFDVKTEVISDKTEEEILLESVPDDPDLLAPRPPVITIMGHVDHGKTSLLDAIRQTNVTEGEAGGITQHIGAYMVATSGKKITFLDTPGHEAFTAMRARGAEVTDIVILVVAADDGVMPQTVEAINHAKIAKVPIIVAINKIDRPDANPDRVKQALSEYGLISEEWGGETIFVEVSAKEKTGLDHLLEMVLLQAEVLELKANPKKQMIGVIVEAKIERGRGPVATVLVQEGTLKVGSAFVTGAHFGKVRSLINDVGRKVKEAGPSMPVEVIGLDGVPLAGDTFIAVEDERVAKEVASSRSKSQRDVKLSQVRRATLDDLYEEIKEGGVQEQNVIIKADVQGSAEALKESLEKLSTDAVKLLVIHGGVGGVSESDVLLAAASNAIIIGFNIRPESKVRDMAEKEKVDIRLYSVIYEAIADVRSAMEGLLEPTLKERILGRVEVRQTFTVPRQGTVAGGYVIEGIASRNCSGVRVIRDNVGVYEGKIASLRRFKDDVKEVQTGYECGLGVENFNDIKVGDILELYVFDKIPAKLESV